MAERNSGTENGYQLPFERKINPLQKQIAELESAQIETGRDYSHEIRQLRAQYVPLLRKTYQNLTPWETVQVARHPNRPLAGDYIARIVRDFVELHGDRRLADDQAIRCGLGRIAAEKAVILAHQYGRGIK